MSRTSGAAEELQHAITIAKQVDYLGGIPTVTPRTVIPWANAKEMLRFDLKNESVTIQAYYQRVRQCEALGRVSGEDPLAQDGRPRNAGALD